MIDLGITPQNVADEGRVTLDMGDQATVRWLQSQIARATREVFLACPGLLARFESGDEMFRAAVRDVVLDAVARTARLSPDEVGLKSESEDSYSYSRDPLAISADIWFPDNALKKIGCGAAGAGTFIPRSARMTVSRGWLGA